MGYDGRLEKRFHRFHTVSIIVSTVSLTANPCVISFPTTPPPVRGVVEGNETRDRATQKTEINLKIKIKNLK